MSYLQPMDPIDLNYASYRYFNVAMREDENVHNYVGIVNRLCTSFRFCFLEEGQF
ncbi:unnamed protein product [Hymenolepis diminuta]|uniref:Uncharacterized protein n=1 Tax=Hymenolepis diminuta TaxID=6216 RepID=A0A564YBA1_HYMDI|nr:unnamed protein product [Hymenolepis diminuta]VUZ44542.1 unnamed protein product [Hymenolepis diminuta]